MTSPHAAPPTLFRLDASPRIHGSRSRALGDHFEQRWRSAHPDGHIIRRCLATQPVPLLDQATIAAFMGSDEGATAALSDTLIGELTAATEVLVTSPLHNFSMPASLKAWIDQVIRHGRTFAWGATGPTGMLTGRAAWLVTTRGGSSAATDDFQVPTLETALAFMGIEIAATVVVGDQANVEAAPLRFTSACHEIDGWLGVSQPEWIGTASPADQRELAALRVAQLTALTSGDAETYATLCTDDIRLLLPGMALVAGLSDFLAVEKRLLSSAPRPRFSKRPERVVVSGDLAVETGWQAVLGPKTAQPGTPAPLVSGPQKYTHVFRRTAAGWRFAVLMSNSAA